MTPKPVLDLIRPFFPDRDDLEDMIFYREGVYIMRAWAIEALAANLGAVVELIPISMDLPARAAAFMAIATTEDSTAITTGEAAPYNNAFRYPCAMAEKRARGRAVLKLAGLHGRVYEDVPHNPKSPEAANALAEEILSTLDEGKNDA